MAINYGQGTADRPSQGWKLFITATAMVIVAGMFVIARLTVRFRSKLFGWDDYTIAFSLLCSVILTLCINQAVVNGYGMHTKDLSHEERKAALGWFYGAQIIYKVLLGSNKVSILFLYLRIFIGRGFRIICWVNMGIVIAWSFGSTIATVFQCIPLAAFWDKKIVNPKCTDTDVFWIAYAVINIITDFIILLLPLWEIRKLHLPRAQRLGLMGVFALGGFVCATSIIRTNAVAASVANKKDSTWTFIPRSTWTLVEANVGIICACLPMLRGLIAPCFPCLERKNKSTTSRPSGYKYPLGSGSDLRATSEGHVMSTIYHKGRGRKSGELNESEEEIFAVGKEHQRDKGQGNVRETRIEDLP